MKLDFTVAANSAFFDENTRLNIIQIFDIVRIKELPSKAPFQPFSIAGKVTGDYGRGVTVSVLSKNNNILVDEVTVTAREFGKPNFNFIVQVGGVIFKDEGDYYVVVKGADKNTIEGGKIKLFSVIINK